MALHRTLMIVRTRFVATWRNGKGTARQFLLSPYVVTDSELKKDAHYSTAYYAVADGVPLLVLGLFPT